MTGISVPRPIFKLTYSGQNITGAIESMVTEVRWHEAMTHEASDISITMQDTQGKWLKSTFPQPGDKVALEIGYAGAPLLYAGQFTIDEFESRGPPSLMTLHGTEAWTTTNFMQGQKTIGFENMTVSAMAQRIANNYGWDLITGEIEPQQDVSWERKTQCQESDWAFLMRLAEDHGFAVNVRPPNLVFYPLAALEAQPPTGPTITQKMVNRFKLRYQNCAEVTWLQGDHTYQNPDNKELQTGQVEATGEGANAVTANTFNEKKRIESNQQASALSAATMHQANMWQYQGEIEMPGTIAFRASQTLALGSDFGYFATIGNWIIDQAEHTFSAASRNGYVTKLTVRTAGPGIQAIPGGAPMWLSTTFRGVAGYKVSRHAAWRTGRRSGGVLTR